MHIECLHSIFSMVFFFNFSKPSTVPKESVETYDSAGVLGKLADISVYDNPSTSDLQSSDDIEPICRQGKSGTK